MLQIQRGALVLASLISASCWAQPDSTKHVLITETINESNLVTLSGNTHPKMTPENDRGAVADNLVLEMNLQLKRAPESQQAMDDLASQLHDPNSAQYHKWLTADQIAAKYGPAEADTQAVINWLTTHGFTVNVVYHANGVIDFSGPASAIREAFHTEIHNLSINGRAHMANASDPKIPVAIAAAVDGVVKLHNFRPHPMSHLRPQITFTCQSQAQCGLAGTNPSSLGYTNWAVGPGDLQTIYNMNPLYAAGITGEGQTIVVLEDSDLFSMADWNAFRSAFGLAQRFPKGSLTQIHPQAANNLQNGGTCLDPGVTTNGDDFESVIDVEWASAAAPNAAIVAAVCASVNTNFQAGAFIALQNLVNGRMPAPAIISISWGEGESEAGASYNAFVKQLYETAVLQGASIFVSSGDSGADADYADYLNGFSPAPHGINVNAQASTPYNVAVGGTDFADTYLGLNNTYWSSTNAANYTSALSYVPEIPWNYSCASQLLASFFGYATTYGQNGFCNSSTAAQHGIYSAVGSQFAFAVAEAAVRVPVLTEFRAFREW